MAVSTVEYDPNPGHQPAHGMNIKPDKGMMHTEV